MNQPQQIGILLANLGTPDEPTPSAVKRYLKQFLSDPRVIDLPKFKWQAILNCIILPRRSPKVAKLYQSVWSEEGSPLLAISRQQQRAVQRYFDAKAKMWWWNWECLTAIQVLKVRPITSSSRG
ncbi:Ferrochelatase [Mannheimia haemolytica]